MKRKSQKLGYFYFFMVAILLLALITGCISDQEAIENANSWNSMVLGISLIIFVAGAGFLILLGLSCIKEWLKKL